MSFRSSTYRVSLSPPPPHTHFVCFFFFLSLPPAIFLSWTPEFLNFWSSKFLDFKISGFLNFKISGSLDSGVLESWSPGVLNFWSTEVLNFDWVQGQLTSFDKGHCYFFKNPINFFYGMPKASLGCVCHFYDCFLNIKMPSSACLFLTVDLVVIY